MSDKIQEERPAKAVKPARRWLIFILIVFVVVILFGLLLLSTGSSMDRVKRFFRYNGLKDGDYGNIKSEASGNMDCRTVGDCFAVGTQNALSLYAEDGTLLAQDTGTYTSPALLGTDECVLAYDIGGTHIAALHTDGKTCFSLDTDGLIYDADLASDGAACVLTEGSDCRAVLEVYRKDGTLLFRRNSKTNYLNACALSPNHEFAVVSTLGEDELSFSSTAQIFDTGSDSVYAEIPLGNQMIYDLFFVDDDTICAVGESELTFFLTEGIIIGDYAPESGSLISYSFGGDGFVTLLYDRFTETNRYCLVTVNGKSMPIASVYSDSTPLDISACGEYVSVLTNMNLLVYNRELDEQYTALNSVWKRACVRPDGTAYGIGSDEVTLFIP